ncbi:MAG: hypothetical protein V3W41_18505 [Planctomycetota bacterium]
MKLALLATLGIVLSLIPGCGSSARNSSSVGNGGTSGNSNFEGLDPNAEAVFGTIRNARIILYQPITRTTMILVNHDHQLRESLKGRQRLALGIKGQGYKVLSDRQIDALLKSMASENAKVIRQPASREDFRYLRTGPGDIPDFKGIILVENNGSLIKYVGIRPNNDPVKAKKLQIYVNLKTLVARWHQANSQVELPSPVMRGRSNPNQFTVPKPSRRLRGANR